MIHTPLRTTTNHEQPATEREVWLTNLARARNVINIVSSDEAIQGITRSIHGKLAESLGIEEGKVNELHIQESLFRGVKSALALIEAKQATVDNPDLLKAWESRIGIMRALNAHEALRLKSLLDSVKTAQ